MTDEKELYASDEPGLSYDSLEVDEGWEQKLAKEIGEMSDEAFDPVAFEKVYNDGKDDYLCGGNTPERVEEQIEWLKKVAENK